MVILKLKLPFQLFLRVCFSGMAGKSERHFSSHFYMHRLTDQRIDSHIHLQFTHSYICHRFSTDRPGQKKKLKKTNIELRYRGMESTT